MTIINMFDVDDSLKNKKCLVLIVDDGADYGIRSTITMHYFGKLFIELNLDVLMVVKNAPKDSRFNPVEHLWGFLTPKLAGMVLPTNLLGEDEDQTLDAESEEVQNQAIDILHNTFKGKKFNTFPVIPVAVHCNAEKIVIEGKEVASKTFDELEHLKDFYDSNLSQSRVRAKDPTTLAEAKFIHNHMDKRTHSIFYRKCMPLLGDKSCRFCTKFPPTVSEALMKDLPRRDSGALFYDVREDQAAPGHNMTFLGHLKNKMELVPDGDLDVQRCKV